jgi:deoxyadenosine/deoxycytidine kinase
MPKRLILLAGNIGAGKTSLTERIGEKLGWATAYESVADNPYLPDFYKSMQDWAFHLQIFYLGHRTEQYLHFMELPKSAILDRSLYEDAHIFARALHHMGNMSDRDYQAYIRLYNLVVKSLPRPDLLIYLNAPVPVLMERIRRRARNIETGISEEYLRLLESFYVDWMGDFDLCPVLAIRSDDLDFVHKSQHLDIVVQRIKEKLSGKEEMVF